MTYASFRETIQKKLERSPNGRTWRELREQLNLPYARPCPEWVKTLEREIGLSRVKAAGGGRALVWRLGAKKKR